MKILISAFPVFNKLSKNPSEELLNILESKKHEIIKVLIPVVWDESYIKLEKKINEVNPDLIIMLGAAGREKFSFESIAKNYRDINSLDNLGLTPKTSYIIENGQAQLLATFDPFIFLNAFNDLNIPCEISKDAGNYLCNETFYKCLYFTKNKKAIFIHIPTKIELDDALKLGKIGFDEVLNRM